MDNFKLYAEYYNLLYKDKDYAGEADYIDGFIRKYTNETKTILDLGCGTGRHAYELFKKGYKLTGVDISENMLKMADNLPKNDIEFVKGDVRTVELSKKFDVVISLFHVLSYQQTNDDVVSMLNTVKKHLKPGGLFICDCWYGPGVMNDKPEVRNRELENDRVKIFRKAEPEIHYDRNIVDVNYTLKIEDKTDSTISEVKETHCMRYFFNPEIRLFMDIKELKVLCDEEWLTGKELGADSWNAVYVCKNTGLEVKS
jgi:SAM-dependent methyltransferase